MRIPVEDLRGPESRADELARTSRRKRHAAKLSGRISGLPIVISNYAKISRLVFETGWNSLVVREPVVWCRRSPLELPAHPIALKWLPLAGLHRGVNPLRSRPNAFILAEVNRGGVTAKGVFNLVTATATPPARRWSASGCRLIRHRLDRAGQRYPRRRRASSVLPSSWSKSASVILETPTG